MRVYDSNLNGAAAAQTGSAQETQRTARSGHGATSSSSASGDRVEFSSTLGALSRALDTHSNDRAARVQELASQYSRGTYRVDAAATSRAMVKETVAASEKS